MSQIKSTIDKFCVCEILINAEEFRQIGITQKFERLGWERVLDWCEGATQRVYPKAVTEWLSTLRLENAEENPALWRLVGETAKGTMVMSFDTMNQIANLTRWVKVFTTTIALVFSGNRVLFKRIRLWDTGKLRAWDLRVLHSLLYGEPKLSWRHITIMNIWDTRNQFKQKVIPYVRLISAMIVQQNRSLDNSLWVVKPIDDIDFSKL
ncbi:hypothetical protein HanXRQr2_Chr04g0192511 [Helianthus annuus]|uniref:Uncharacterized protein n=1 Tax=Helianthus annuus TaxID=4232 RepID=A0A9K3JBK4_HELAN|nr:hypothetical protein HanXRQr2_Chr04g0192511 [Helianthus annuus]KAJ0598972.1 hypothetical protein HanHA89_Chr04g0171591 [Helianthus annuus]